MHHSLFHRLSQETIDPQHDDFADKLTSLLAVIRNEVLDGKYKSPDEVVNCDELDKITDLVFKRFGLKINLIVNQGLAQCLPFYVNKNHVFIDPNWRGQFTISDQEKLLKKMDNKTGYVDLKAAKVGGIFSEHTCEVHINMFHLFQDLNMTARQVGAIVSHELGHLFTACEYSDRLESTNQVLANVARELMSKDRAKKTMYIYRELKSINDDVSEKDIDDLVNSSGTILGLKMFSVVVGIVTSQMKQSAYDKTSFESQSDAFASRLGFGSDLVTALDLLLKHSPERSAGMYYSIRLLELMIFAGKVAAVVFMLANAPLLGVFYGILFTIILRFNGDDTREMTYDGLKDRYARVRLDLIAQIKNFDNKFSDREALQELLERIYQIDDMVKGVRNFTGLETKLSNLIFSEARAAKNSILQQQQLEQLANNDLFMYAAQFKS